MYRKIITSTIIALIVCFITIHCFAFGPSKPKMYQGIDVSRWQGNIDFSAVKKSGIDIVYMKS